MRSIKRMISRQLRSIRFYKYFLSYLFLLLAILVLFGSIVYRNFISTLQQETEASNISALCQIRDTMDTRIQELDRIALHIFSNPNLRAYKALNSKYDALEAIQELAQYKSTNEFASEVFLYHNYQGVKRMFLTDMDVDVDTFFNYLYQNADWNKNNFLTYMSKYPKPVILPVQTISGSNAEPGTGPEKGYATYVYPLPLNITSPGSAVMYLIDGQKLSSMLKNALNNNGEYMYLLDENKRPIICVADMEQKTRALDLLKVINSNITGDGIRNISFLDERYSIVRISSNYNEWSYITAMKTAKLMGKVYTKRNLLSYVALIVLVLGMMISYAMATSNYKPLIDLSDLISGNRLENGTYKKTKRQDELALISNTIDAVAKENKGLLSKLNSKAEIMKEQLLSRLLVKHMSDREEVKSLCEISGVCLEYSLFAVLIFLIDDYSEIEASSKADSMELLKFSVINIVEELSSEIGHGYGLELDNGREVAVLLNLKPECGKERFISELAFKTKDYFKQFFKATLTVGVGSIYDDMGLVHKSFQEANRAEYFRLVKGRNSVIFYEDIKDIQKKVYKYPVDRESELIMAIKQGKSDEVERIIRDFREYIVEQQLLPESVQYTFLGFINAIFKTLDEMDVEVNKSFDVDKEGLFAGTFETIDEQCDRITAFCSKLCSFIAENKESKNFELREIILAYIIEHYHNKTLTLESIADHFGMSSVYIGRYFKDQTGFTLMKYIDIMRMNKAKELLKNTNLIIRDILEPAGYVDEANFMRKFKKNEGMTPIQYRNIAQNGNRNQ